MGDTPKPPGGRPHFPPATHAPEPRRSAVLLYCCCTAVLLYCDVLLYRSTAAADIGVCSCTDCTAVLVQQICCTAAVPAVLLYCLLYCIVMRHLWATVRGHEATYMPLLYLGEVYQWLRIMSHMIGNVPEWFPVRDT